MHSLKVEMDRRMNMKKQKWVTIMAREFYFRGSLAMEVPFVPLIEGAALTMMDS
jgi:hypothetical protein